MQIKANKNGVKLLAAVIVFAMAFAAVIAFVPASDAATDGTTELGGTITSADQTFGPGTEVIVISNLNIPAESKLTIEGKFTVNSGVKITVDGELDIKSTAAAYVYGDISVNETGKATICHTDGAQTSSDSVTGASSTEMSKP